MFDKQADNVSYLHVCVCTHTRVHTHAHTHTKEFDTLNPTSLHLNHENSGWNLEEISEEGRSGVSTDGSHLGSWCDAIGQFTEVTRETP